MYSNLYNIWIPIIAMSLIVKLYKDSKNKTSNDFPNKDSIKI